MKLSFVGHEGDLEVNQAKETYEWGLPTNMWQVCLWRPNSKTTFSTFFNQVVMIIYLHIPNITHNMSISYNSLYIVVETTNIE